MHLMKKSRGRLNELLECYFNQDISETDKDELWEYVLDPMYKEQISTQIPDVMSNLITAQDRLSEDKQKNILDQTFQDDKKTTKTIVSLWRRVGIAAAIATIIVGAGIFHYAVDHKKQGDFITNSNGIVPGKQGATLTLANGKKIKLSDVTNGELAKEAGVSISKNANGQLIYEIIHQGEADNQLNTLSTANGETYQVHLPDGSLVFLNAASSLTYAPSLIKAGKRQVTLRGEAYFEVKKDEKSPFIVKTDQQEVKVLGTHFNISNYDTDPEIKTTLLEGKVQVTAKKTNRSEFLIPGQQSVLSESNFYVNNQVDVEEAIAWKNGYFKFNGSLEAIMQKVARWYDIEVIYKKKPDSNLAFGAEISMQRNISALLKLIEETGNVNFKIEGRRVFVM
jgi:transmembrane sensor